jgi:four helix bundle protein
MLLRTNRPLIVAWSPPIRTYTNMSSSYRDLIAWQKAMAFADAIYSTVKSFPNYELFGLSSQMRRAALSVPFNISEGQGRGSFRDFRLFLRRARASALELENAIEVARRQGYISVQSAGALTERCAETLRLINGLIRNLTKRIEEQPRTADRKLRTMPRRTR